MHCISLLHQHGNHLVLKRASDCRAGEAAAAQQHLHSMCDDLAAQNALLRSQLAAAAELLRGERASFQAERHALRQKVLPSLPLTCPRQAPHCSRRGRFAPLQHQVITERQEA